MMMMFGQMSCKKAMTVLQSYLDGEVSEKAARKVTKHLANCTDCEFEGKAFARIKESIATSQVPLDETVLRNLREFVSSLTDDAS